jgi:hypothetical protein
LRRKDLKKTKLQLAEERSPPEISQNRSWRSSLGYQ